MQYKIKFSLFGRNSVQLLKDNIQISRKFTQVEKKNIRKKKKKILIHLRLRQQNSALSSAKRIKSRKLLHKFGLKLRRFHAGISVGLL